MDTIDRIMLLMKDKKINGAKLSRDCELGNAVFYQWKSRRSSPSAEALVRVANYLDTTVEFLTGQKEKPTPVSESGPTDDELITMWQSLSPDEIQRVKDFALGMIANRPKPPAHPE